MSLQSWNYAAVVLHIGMLIYVFTIPNKNVTLYKFKYEVDTSPSSDLDYALTTEEGKKTSIKPFVLLFFGITAIAHLLYALNFWGYEAAIENFGWNPLRWFEYSLTASLMIYVIAIVAGAKEESTALTAALITPGLMLQGLTVEREIHQNALAAWASFQAPKPDIDPVLVWANFLPAWFFFGLKWFIIFHAYNVLKKQLKEEGKTIDPKITQLVFIQFACFSVFGIIQTCQIYGWWTKTRGHWSQGRFIMYEKAYIVMSFLAKALLGFSVARL